MKRGELWTVAGAQDYAGKPRPALILQDDPFSNTRSITLCLVTSDPVEVPAARVLILPSAGNGLHQMSNVMADKITTVSRTKIGTRIGRLNESEMAEVDRAVMVFLGLAS